MNKNPSKTTWDFQDLMQYRIHEILLIASPYDAFILEQDGKLTEQILSEFVAETSQKKHVSEIGTIISIAAKDLPISIII